MDYRIERNNIIVDNDGHEYIISFTALAAWQELLGIEDDIETIEAMIHTFETGEPEADIETGRNHWTDAYEALAARERQAAAPVELRTARNSTRRALQLEELPEPGQPVRRAMSTPSSSPLSGLQSLLDENRGKLNAAREDFLQQFRTDSADKEDTSGSARSVY